MAQEKFDHVPDKTIIPHFEPVQIKKENQRPEGH